MYTVQLKKVLIVIVWISCCFETKSQTYPAFGPEIPVTITGLTFDAMEPFLSADENTMFFNSLNSGGNTNLYYATKVNDSVFTYAGLVTGCYDPTPDHLDGVASLDSTNRFFWVSLRNYPAQMENLHNGIYSSGGVTFVKRTYGDFNIYLPGWLIMDACINYPSDLLYYCNARFGDSTTGCIPGIPCEASLGVAQKINDTTFSKLSNTDVIFSQINDTNYVVYAPQVSVDGLELYYSRFLKTTFSTQVCVAIRNTTTDPFSLPFVIHENVGYFPEASTVSNGKQKLYYHQKNSLGMYQLYLRYKTGIIGTQENYLEPNELVVFPNPTSHVLQIRTKNKGIFQVLNVDGKVILETIINSGIDKLNISHLNKGVYFIRYNQQIKKIILL